ncbi:MAG: hypothetical protein H5T78_02940 [Nocardia sp.]|nr:hypothetical protein [Nocardia sp.]
MFPARTRAQIECAAQDFAATYYGGPWRFGIDDAARYVTSEHLRPVVTEYGHDAVAAAVRAYLTAHPELLTRARAERETAARFRAELAAARITAAARATEQGDYPRARRLLTAAEEIEPRPEIDGYRARIDAAENAAHSVPLAS